MLTLRRSVVGVVAVLLVSGVAWAQTPATIAEWRVQANAGDAAAQYNLGMMYGRGQSVPQDFAQAITWYRKAADQGDAEAQYNLGFMYFNGQGVPQDDAQVEAAAWFRKAADQGHALAQSLLGVMYQYGRGVPQDDAQAVAWTRKAAEQGEAPAQASLGAMYHFGRGVPQDFVESHKWRNLAASRLSEEQSRELFAHDTEPYKARDALAKLMTPAQIAEAQQRATAWQAAFDARQE
jgi:TPR repeat protein